MSGATGEGRANRAPPQNVRSAKSAAPLVHPSARRTVGVFVGLSLLAGAAAALSAMGGDVLDTAALGVACAGGTWFSLWLLRALKTTAIHNRATDVLLRGELDEADAMLAPLASAWGRLGQSVCLQQTSVALLRGDMVLAESRASIAIARAPRPRESSPAYGVVMAATAIRALARASQGNDAGARADIAAVRAGRAPQVTSLARVAVAELVVLSREPSMEGLIHALAQNERVLEAAQPRERALVRGFERMVATGGSSAYRKLQPRETEEDAVSDWVAQVAPGVRKFVIGSAGQKVVAAAPERSRSDAPPLRKKRGLGSTRARLVGVWLLLVGTFVVVYEVLSVEPGAGTARHHAAASPPFQATGGLVSFVFLAFALFIFVRIRRATRDAVRMRDLESAIQLDDAHAISRVESLSAARAPAKAANALFLLAQHHERSARFVEALAAAEAGLNRIETSAAMRNAYSDILVPGLHVQRAVALAALGRTEDARDAAIALSAGFPGYAFLSTALLRIDLIATARAGDFARACAIGEARGADLPITYRDELLCAMLRAATHGAEEDERARISHVLARKDRVRAWVAAVAPGLVDAQKAGEPAHALERSSERETEEEEPESLTVLAHRGA